MSYIDPPESRGPGRGRPAGYREPVTVVSISMDPATLRDIDEYALRNGRSRSAFVRWVLMSYIKLKRDRDAEKAASFDEPEFDPTHGGRFDPSLIGLGTWECVACAEADDAVPPTLNQRVVTGWLNCPGCKTPRGDAPTIPAEVSND